MKLRIIHTGKTKFNYVEELCADYLNRIGRYAPIEECFTDEIKNSGSLPPDQLKSREGERMLKLIGHSAYLVLFDEKGKHYSSTGFAAWLEKRLMLGKSLVFATGGAYGFAEEVYQRADEKISLSKMTFSHQMVRILVAEQIYRAFTILNNEKYHH